MNQSKCTFLVSEIVQGIVHGSCNNPYMREINKVPPDESIPCIGSARCGIAVCDTGKNQAGSGAANTNDGKPVKENIMKTLALTEKQVEVVRLALQTLINALDGKNDLSPLLMESLAKLLREYSEELFASAHSQGG
jgi:hypothetical protein